MNIINYIININEHFHLTIFLHATNVFIYKYVIKVL